MDLFQARTPQPSVFVRTLLQHYTFGEMVVLGHMSTRQLLDDDLASTVLPADSLLDRLNDEYEQHPQSDAFQISEKMEIFRTRAAQPYLDILRTLCQNRCRVRRTLVHLVGEWDILQLDAEELDILMREHTHEKPLLVSALGRSPVYSFPLSSWAYFNKLKLMEWIVSMGFELDIYQHDEIAGMYYYLQYLCQRRVKHTERMLAFVKAPPRPIDDPMGQRPKAKVYLETSLLEAVAHTTFADTLSSFFTVLMRLGLVKTPKRPYSDDRKRYEVRMRPFIRLSLPELVPFETFREESDQKDLSTTNVLDFAAQGIKDAKASFEKLTKSDASAAGCVGVENEWREKVKSELKSCIWAGLMIAKVSKAFAANDGSIEKLKVEIPESKKAYHGWWIVPHIS